MKDALSGVGILVLALLLVCCSAPSADDVRQVDVTRQCPEGELHTHRISPDLDPVLTQGIIKAVDEWASIIGSKHPQSIVISSDASKQNITCVTSWIYNDEAVPPGAFAVTEAGAVHFTRSAMPASIKLQLPLHEMGHVLGLGDAKVMDSVMWKFIGPGQPITCQDRKDVCLQQSCDPGC
jgi:hypothetical protein